MPYITPFLVGANCGFRKEVFKNTRYYDLYAEKMVGEDMYFNWQLSKQGRKLIFLPSVAVKHLNKRGLLKVLRYQYKLGSGACHYRFYVSVKMMCLLIKMPYLTFLLPVGIVPWIGFHILRKQGILELFKFVILLPLLYIGNYVWAVGFFRELSIIKSNSSENC